ncbi:hypothetical protein GQ42DRAFT_165771 [Ramicandelaber brevisporus]|nr:hypothetical protein GQ42DRAFT_165771 [Ramicandelaber brevisporus]
MSHLVRLSAYLPSDNIDKVDYVRDNPSAVYGLGLSTPYTLDNAQRFCTSVTVEPGSPIHTSAWAIRDRSTSKFCGCIAIHNVGHNRKKDQPVNIDEPFGDDDWTIGYHIAERFQGKGIMTEVIKAVINKVFYGKDHQLFETSEGEHGQDMQPAIQPGIKRIFVNALCDNLASLRVIEKTGFKRIDFTDEGFRKVTQTHVKRIWSVIEA